MTVRWEVFNRIRPLLWLACLVSWVVVLAAGLWPLNFTPKNGVEWAGDARGIRFDGWGIVTGSVSNIVSELANLEPAPVTIEFKVTPQTDSSGGLPQIITLYSPESGEDFFIGQWKSYLIIRSRVVAAPAVADYREAGMRDVFFNGREVLVTITSAKGNTSIFLNGSLGRIVRRFSLCSASAADSGMLVLGTAPSGKEGWKGTMSGLALYNRALSADEVYQSAKSWVKTGGPLLQDIDGLAALYKFDEGGGEIVHNAQRKSNDLRIPRSFRPLKGVFLEPNLRRIGMSRSFLSDVALNILGFVPFAFFQGGWFLVRTSLRRPYIFLLTVLIGSGLSLFIELVQAYLPTRSSDLIDLISNIVGSLLGALLLLHITKKAAPKSGPGMGTGLEVLSG
jgi:hypothetical protein